MCYLCTRKTNIGTLAERLGNGLQNRVEQFDSARYLLKGNIHVNVAFFIYLRFVWCCRNFYCPIKSFFSLESQSSTDTPLNFCCPMMSMLIVTCCNCFSLNI